MKSAFLAWCDPLSRSWFPVARVTSENGGFLFEYVKGAESAELTKRFTPIEPFGDLHRVYHFDSLLPILANRLPSANREDYTQFVQWLDLPPNFVDPLVLLGRSGASRQTDDFEMFPLPEPDSSGHFEIHFFVHGLRHFPAESMQRVLALRNGDPLSILWDLQNPFDSRALALRTNESLKPGDRYLIGYCPRYLNKDLLDVLVQSNEQPRVIVERVNPPPAPPQVRLLCRLTAKTNPEFSFFSTGDFVPLAGQSNTATV